MHSHSRLMLLCFNTHTHTMTAAAGPSTHPTHVLYCGICSLPVEYCEFGASLTKCKTWLEEADEAEYERLYSEDALKDKIGTLSLDKQEKIEQDAAKAERKAEKKAETEKKKKAVGKGRDVRVVSR